MICVVVVGPGIEEAKEQIKAAIPVAGIVELYLDSFHTLDLDELKELKNAFSIPMLFTLRSEKHGKRLQKIRQLATLKPAYLDLESSDCPSFIEEIKKEHPEINLILSHHDFQQTPDLEHTFALMRKIPVDFYKIAAKAKNTLDAMRLITWSKKLPSNVVAISMGIHGQMSRILAPWTQRPFTYASIASGKESAPGQIPAAILIEQYNYISLNSKTAFYGLIGDPISGSISDITHNLVFKHFNLNAVYVKMTVKPDELRTFLDYAKKLGIQGLSVTMPLKEAILPFLDSIDPVTEKIGAVNTLRFEKEKIFGCNTDGIGALNALEKHCSVKEKRIAIIGAGGAAKSIAYEAHRRGALVLIINRSLEKAQQLAESVQGKAFALDAFYCEHDILINTTSCEFPISSSQLLGGTIVMDIKTRPKQTQLLKKAKKKGCHIIYGYEMFIEQALGQFQFWFDNQITPDDARKILTSSSLSALSSGEEAK